MLDDLYGFFGAQFEDSTTSIPHLQFKGNYQKKRRFRQTEVPAAIAGVTFEFVDYLFYNKQLHSIFVRTAGIQSSQAFLEHLQLLFGEGVQDGMAPRYTWQGERVELFYDRNLLTGNADIVFTSLPMQKVFKKDYIILDGR